LYNIIQANGGVCASDGFFADGVSAGLKPDNAKDLAFIYSDTECDIASVFTTNKMMAAPIRHFRLRGDFKTNFVLINSKNANAMTGNEGIEDIDEILSTCQNVTNPIMSSTGVIGVRLPKQKIIDGIKLFDLTKRDSSSAAKAIMTTDTFAKEISFRVELDNKKSFHIGAIAKVAGMINPAMATMLCFITTDAKINQEELQEILNQNLEKTFNAISVDGDMSTNDSVFIYANSQSGVYNKDAFNEALMMIMHHLALELVKDGEGATKLVSFKINGAKNNKEAQIVAKNMRNSLLVKTAIFGSDPNWGRLAMAIGASGVECNEDSLIIKIGGVTLYDKGDNLMSKEIEEKTFKQMQKDQFIIECDLGIANGSYTAYGCDLGYEYVKINADYRT